MAQRLSTPLPSVMAAAKLKWRSATKWIDSAHSGGRRREEASEHGALSQLLFSVLLPSRLVPL